MTANAQQEPGDGLGARQAGAGDGPRDADEEAGGYDELRALIVGRDLEKLGDLSARLDDPERYAEEVSRALPDAVSLSTGRDDRLAAALRPTVEGALYDSVRRDPEVLASALYPAIMPAIRNAAAAALREFVQTLNRTLERSFSVRGLRWRLEALRTGRPFAEVVLLHSVVYRVEQVFLIHAESGLLLQHVVDPSIEAPEAELVSSMLTAIQDFARDALKAGQTDALESTRLGQQELWVERGPHAIVAGLMRGQAPVELRRVFVAAVEGIHRDLGDALANFDGDVEPFEAARPYLEACLASQFAEEEQKASPMLVGVAAAVALAVVAGTGYWLWQRSKWNGYVERLRATPGIVVTEADSDWWSWRVEGLRDPLAPDPEALMREAGLDAGDVRARWEPYHSFAPEFLPERARAILAPPPSVELRVDAGRVAASGEAPHAWIVQARRLAKTIPGVVAFDERDLVDADRRELSALERRLEGTVVLFVVDSAQPVAGMEDEIDALARDLGALFAAARSQDVAATVDVVGHTDSSGTETTNSPLSEQRARRLVELLAARGLDVSGLRVRGVATSAPVRPETTPEDAAFNRSVTLEVSLSE